MLLIYYYVIQKWTGDILLKSLEEGRSLISIEKTAEKLGAIGSCIPVMHALTGSNTVPNNIWYWKCVCIDCRAKESTGSCEKLGYT